MSEVVAMSADAEGFPIVVLKSGQVFVWYDFYEDGYWYEITPVPNTQAWVEWIEEGRPELGAYK